MTILDTSTGEIVTQERYLGNAPIPVRYIDELDKYEQRK